MVAQRTFESWGQEFQFSKDLQELEKQVSIHSAPGATHSMPEDDDITLDHFSDTLAGLLVEKMSQEAFVEKLVQAHQLKADNQVLAAQIKTLLKEKESYERELRHMDERLSRFKKVMGNLYLQLETL